MLIIAQGKLKQELVEMKTMIKNCNRRNKELIEEMRHVTYRGYKRNNKYFLP
jgi:hypothetical protein